MILIMIPMAMAVGGIKTRMAVEAFMALTAVGAIRILMAVLLTTGTTVAGDIAILMAVAHITGMMEAGAIGILTAAVHIMKQMEIHITMIQAMTVIQIHHPHLQTQALSISGETDFTSTSRFPYDARIEITYHVVKEITVPMSAKSAKKLVYTDLAEQFKAAGFVNITLEAEYDLITGWITKDGSIESVSVNGETSFDEYASYRPDVPVVITYHTFSKNKDD